MVETEDNKEKKVVPVKPTTVDTTKQFRNISKLRNSSRDTRDTLNPRDSPGRGISIYERITSGNTNMKPLLSDRVLVKKDAPVAMLDRRNRRASSYFQDAMTLAPIQRKA